MTKREREQVVELLRCAADLETRNEKWPPIICGAEYHLGFGCGSINWPGAVATLAISACAGANDGHGLGCSSDIHGCVLEAAQRVEEGSWP